MRYNVKDIAAGSFFIAVGLFFVLNAWLKLAIGTAFRMGPGYFPMLLGGILLGLGAIIVLKAFASGFEASGRLPIRGIIFVGLAPIAFGLTIEGLGLIGAVALSTALSALSSCRIPLRFAIALTLGLTAFCVAVFHYGLGLPMQLLGPWISEQGN